jgi:hypothetical protein
VARNSASHFEPEENWGKIKWGGVLVGLADAEEEGGCSAMGCATWQAAGTGPRAPSAGGHPKQGTPRWLLGGVLATVRGGALEFISNSNSNRFQIEYKSFQTLADPKRTFSSSKKLK